MGALRALNLPIGLAAVQLPALLNDDPWATATDAQRRKAGLVTAVIAPVIDAGLAAASGACWLHLKLKAHAAPMAAQQAAALLGRELPSEPTLKRWVLSFRAGGKNALLPQHKGRPATVFEWQIRATHLWANGVKSGYADIAWKLRGEGYEVKGHQVMRHIQRLVASVGGENSPARMGKHLYKLNRKKYTRRHMNDVLPGDIYIGDGHTADCYVAHPSTGGLHRAELTVFMDAKSRYVVGWFMSESETKESTLFALRNALRDADHVPAFVYVDRGPGYRAKMLSADTTGWYTTYGIGLIGALPGNANGKGWIERFFRTVRDKHDKFFEGGEFYCGDDMAPEINRRLSVDVKTGKRRLASLAQYRDSFTQWLNQYHNEPMDVLDGATPKQVWAGLQKVAVGTPLDAIARQRVERTVGHEEVRLDNRHYYAQALFAYDGQKVLVEYDLEDDRDVWVLDMKGRFIVKAPLVHKIPMLPDSRMEQQKDIRAVEQIKRLEQHADEARARRQDPITASTQFADIEALSYTPSPTLPAPALALPASQPAPDFDIDLTNWRKDQ